MTASPEQLGPRAASDCLVGGGEMGALMRSIDWARTPLGPIEGWPQSLRTSVSLCLGSRLPILVWWGPELVMLYNDAYRPILGATKHPQAMGRRGREVWPEVWPILGPMLEGVVTQGQATWSDDQLLLLDRNGDLEECYFTFSYSPIRDESGGVGGVFCAATETTRRVLGERRLQTLRALSAQATQAKTVEGACAAAARTIRGNPRDLPFALLYLLDEDARQVRLCDAVGLAAGTRASPASFRIDGEGDVWSFLRVLDASSSEIVENLEERFGRLPAGPWTDEWTRRALVLLLTRSGAQEPPSGFLVAGLSPRLGFDDGYRGFLELAAGQIATAIANVRAYEEERRRAEALAEHLRLQRVWRATEEALRASEAKFSIAFGHSPLALTITSVDDGRLVEVNEGFVRLSGYTREEAVGRTPEELGLWVDPKVRAERFARLQAGEPVPHIEARFRIKNGEELIGVIGSALVEINSRRCVLSSVTDISERQRAEEALREAHALLRAAMDAGRLGAWQWDIPRNEITWTDRIYEFHGMEPGTFGGTVEDFARLVHPEDLPAVQDALEQAMSRQAHYELEFRTVRPNGEVRWVFTRAEVFADAAGAPVRMIGITQDVTERKQTEEALKEADRRKDEFLAMLAHELRNPLAPIRNAAQVLKLVGPADAHQQWAREVIERQTQHLMRLVDDLLDVSRITRGKVTLAREPLDLATILHRAVEACRPLIDARHHRLTVALPPEPVRLEGDLTRLVQVVGNLLNNAAKYTDEGGNIRLEAAREDGEAVLRVRDDGMGISADLLPHVFDLFTQADRSLDRSQGGLGIGLTLVRQLVEMHGGRVEAKSDGPGRGSELIVRLPALAPDAAAEDAEVAAGERSLSAPRGLKILVVEDNVDSAEMMSFLLKLGGHEVRTAHDGPAALEAARAFQPQAVLCDIGLPGMSGYEVAARLREQPALRRTPLIALTGYGQEEARRRAKEAGFDYHLVKPVEPDALDALLDSLRSDGPG